MERIQTELRHNETSMHDSDMLSKLRKNSNSFDFLFSIVEYRHSCLNKQLDTVERLLNDFVGNKQLPSRFLGPILEEAYPFLRSMFLYDPLTHHLLDRQITLRREN